MPVCWLDLIFQISLQPCKRKELHMNARTILISLLSCLSITTYAQNRPEGIHPSYVSIQTNNDPIDGPSIISTICGGVVVDEVKKIVATAWHCVPNVRASIEKPGVFTIGGSNAKLVAIATEADTALFQVDNLKGLKGVKIATPKKGDIIVASAYYEEFPVFQGLQDRYTPQVSIKVTLDWEGKVNAVAVASRRGGERGDQVTKTPYKWIVVTGNPAPGFSGGPVFDKAGNFVGLVSGGNGGFTNVTSSENVLNLLKTIK